MSFKEYLKETDEMRFCAISDLVFDLLFFSVQVHAWHLQTSSYTAHMALKDLYDSVPSLVDDVAEALIGINRKLVLPTKPYTFIQDGATSVDGIVASINSFKCSAQQLISNEDVGIDNSLTDIISLFDKTIYKLTNLR